MSVQVVLPPEAIAAGEQDSDVKRTGDSIEMDVVFVVPLRDAVTTATLPVLRLCVVELAETAVAAKVPVTWPDAKLTDAGTVSSALLSDSATVIPPAGAAALSVMLQLLVPPGDSVDGVQPRPLMEIGAARVTVAVRELPFSVAVMIARESVVKLPLLAVNEPLDEAAAIVTDAGTVRFALLSERATTVPPAAAGLLRVTAQVVSEDGPIEVGEQLSEMIVVGEVSAIEAVFAIPFQVAVTTAVESAAMLPALAANVVLVWLAATVTEAGVERIALLSDTATTAPPAGAGPLRVNVQVLLSPARRVPGEQARVLSTTGTVSEMDAVLLLPFRLAVTTAVESALTLPALAANVAVVAPAATVTEDGTVRLVLLSDSATTVPPDGEALPRVTVQVLAVPDVRELGAQVRLERTTGATTGTVMTPPVAVMGVSIPLDEDAFAPVTEIAMLVAPGATVAFTRATAPFGIGSEFIPNRTHATVLAPLVHTTDLPAAVAAEPGVTVSEDSWPAGYEKTHCALAGALPVALRLRLNSAAPLASEETELSESDAVWAAAVSPKARSPHTRTNGESFL